jgi:hypothetical protein
MYYYDLYFEHNDKKYIVEYNTPIFHPDTQFMNESDFNNWRHIYNKDITAYEKMTYDYEKYKFAEDLGYILIVFYVKETKDTDMNINYIIKLVQSC